MSWLRAARTLTVIAAALWLVACAPGELPTPTEQEAAALLGESFPTASITVRGVERQEQELTVPAEFNAADVVFKLSAGEDSWRLDSIEQGARTYTVEGLRAIATTVETLRALSDALAAYQAANESFPTLDDLVGLRELVPDYYSADAELEDAWGNAFRYRPQGDDYNLSSDGPDGVANTPDDIVVVTGSFAG